MSRPRSIHSIQDAESGTINLLIYSHPGEGKTPFWGTGGERLLLMDSDDGYESAIASGSKAKRATATTYSEMEELYDYFKHDTGCQDFDWVVWDGLTLFQDRAMIDDIMEDAMIARKAEPGALDRWVPSRKEYFIDHNRIGNLVRNFVALPINFGISCHVMVDTDPNDGQTVWMPAVQGKQMSSKVCGYMNVVALLGTAQVKGPDNKPSGKTVKRLLCQREGKLWARDRFNALGHHVDSPTVPKITNMINEKRNGTAEAAPTKPRARKRVRRAS